MEAYSKPVRRRSSSASAASSSSSSRRPTRKRRHLHLIDPRDGAEILPDRRVYTLVPATKWKVEVMMDEPEQPEYVASFRTVSVINEHEPEPELEPTSAVFTLSLQGTNLYPLRVRIWPNNEVEYECHVPLTLRVHPRKKVISIRLLASVRSVAEGVEVTYKGDE
ncbi:MAG: hypothetical protein HC884_03550 [Chloroflexaceae bacterium]|nr:hypothetical protein [Chloroflexaceae bacterium]